MDKKLTGLIVVLFISFAFFASLVFFKGSINTRAKESLQPSGNTSLMLVYPLEIPTNGGQTTVTFFARDINTKPVANKTVTFETTSGNLTPATLQTDADGKATTIFTCSTSGIAQLHAIIDTTIPVKQQVSIKCN